MPESSDIASAWLKEWTYQEDNSGIVYCLGRNVLQDTYEAVAVYERSRDGSGLKQSLEGDAGYNRLMYHGFPEEDKRLASMHPEIQSALIGNLSLRERCLFIDPEDMATVDQRYRTIEAWLSGDDNRMIPFRQALESACEIMNHAGISITDAELYGGAAFGLVGMPGKQVDDVDLIVKVKSDELFAGAQEMQQPVKWCDIDPGSILTERRKLLKVKRWSTSQIRVYEPDFLSIDLKIARDPDQPSLWDEMPGQRATGQFEDELKVVDDSETYCISPAVLCEDRKGNRRTVLFRGYPYIGCAVKDDNILVRGSTFEDSGVILVTQSADDLLIPDFSNVSIS